MEGNLPAWWPMSGLDLIPDAETALKIGRVLLERYYGDSLVRRYEPYRASHNAINVEEWVVFGSREDKSVTGTWRWIPRAFDRAKGCESDTDCAHKVADSFVDATALTENMLDKGRATLWTNFCGFCEDMGAGFRHDRPRACGCPSGLASSCR